MNLGKGQAETKCLNGNRPKPLSNQTTSCPSTFALNANLLRPYPKPNRFTRCEYIPPRGGQRYSQAPHPTVLRTDIGDFFRERCPNYDSQSVRGGTFYRSRFVLESVFHNIWLHRTTDYYRVAKSVVLKSLAIHAYSCYALLQRFDAKIVRFSGETVIFSRSNIAS